MFSIHDNLRFIKPFEGALIWMILLVFYMIYEDVRFLCKSQTATHMDCYHVILEKDNKILIAHIFWLLITMDGITNEYGCSCLTEEIINWYHWFTSALCSIET